MKREFGDDLLKFQTRLGYGGNWILWGLVCILMRCCVTTGCGSIDWFVKLY